MLSWWRTLHIDLQVQYNLCQDPTWLFGRKWRAGSKIHMEMQDTQSSQCSLEKKIALEDSCFPISKLISEPQ